MNFLPMRKIGIKLTVEKKTFCKYLAAPTIRRLLAAEAAENQEMLLWIYAFARVAVKLRKNSRDMWIHLDFIASSRNQDLERYRNSKIDSTLIQISLTLNALRALA